MVIDESFLDKQSFEKFISIKKRNKIAISGIVNKNELAKLDSEFNRIMFNKSFQSVEPKYWSFEKTKKDPKSKSYFTSPLIDEEKDTLESELESEDNEAETEDKKEEENKEKEDDEEEEIKTPTKSKKILGKSVIPKTPIFLREKLYDVLWYKRIEKDNKPFIWPALVIDPGDLDSKTLSEYRKYENDIEKKMIPIRLFNMPKKKQWYKYIIISFFISVLAKKNELLDFNVANNNLFLKNRKADANLSIAFYLAFYSNGIKRNERKLIKEEGDAGCCKCFRNDLDENDNELYSLVYCDKCDLAYHWKCLNYLRLPKNVDEETVVCNRCIYTPNKMKTIIRKGGEVQVLHPEEEENELSDNDKELSSPEKKKSFENDESENDSFVVDDEEDDENNENSESEDEDNEEEEDDDDEKSGSNDEIEDLEDEDDGDNENGKINENEKTKTKIETNSRTSTPTTPTRNVKKIEISSSNSNNVIKKPRLIKPRKTVVLSDSDEEKEEIEKLSSTPSSQQQVEIDDEVEEDKSDDDDENDENDENEEDRRLEKIIKERKEIKKMLKGKIPSYEEKEDDKKIEEKENPLKRKLINGNNIISNGSSSISSVGSINSNNSNEDLQVIKRPRVDKTELIREIDRVIIAIKSIFKKYSNYYKLMEVVNDNTFYVTKSRVLAEIFAFFKYIICKEHSRDTLNKIKENINDFENSFRKQAREIDNEALFSEMIKRLHILMDKQLDKISKISVACVDIYTVKWDIDMNWPCIIVAEYDLPPDVASKYQYYLTTANYVCIRYFCKSYKYAFSVVHSKRLLPLTLEESYKQIKKSKNEDVYDAYNAAYYANGLDLKSRLSIISIENAGCCKCFHMNREGCEPGIDGLVDCQFCKLSYHWKCAGFEERPDDDEVNNFICENCRSMGITLNDLPTQFEE